MSQRYQDYDILSGIGIIKQPELDYSRSQIAGKAALEELPLTEQEACEAGIKAPPGAYDENGIRVGSNDLYPPDARNPYHSSQEAFERYRAAMAGPDEERPRALRGLGFDPAMQANLATMHRHEWSRDDVTDWAPPKGEIHGPGTDAATRSWEQARDEILYAKYGDVAKATVAGGMAGCPGPAGGSNPNVPSTPSFYMRRAQNGGWMIANMYEDIPIACFASTSDMLHWLEKELRNYA